MRRKMAAFLAFFQIRDMGDALGYVLHVFVQHILIHFFLQKIFPVKFPQFLQGDGQHLFQRTAGVFKIGIDVSWAFIVQKVSKGKCERTMRSFITES